jgi:23S rRNA pseudouridine2457 synthase
MANILLFNKPYDVLTQFTDSDARTTLANWIRDPALSQFYPAGRLDRDSEGLLILTDNGRLQNWISDPKHKLEKCYWVQVEGSISDEALQQLRSGVELKDGLSRPAKAKAIDEPILWDRSKPVRFRKHIPTSWLELKIREGRNRQVRRMTAAVGFPTLRLVRYSIGDWNLDSKMQNSNRRLQPGEYILKDITVPDIVSKPGSKTSRKTAKPAPYRKRPSNKKK